MLTGVLRPFNVEDLDSLQASPVLRDLFRRILDNQGGGTFAAVATVPYGVSVWDKRAAQLPPSREGLRFAIDGADAVGIVTRGVFEIYEVARSSLGATDAQAKWKGHAAKERLRRRTTQLLEPGMLFGLFEKYAGWRGPWTIVSGVISFLIANPCGNQERWSAAAREYDVKHLQLGIRSNCEFDALIPPEARGKWTAECVYLYPEAIKDNALRLESENFLRQATVEQLHSVLRQNLTWSGVGDEYAAGEAGLFLKYVDSVIDSRTPMFQLLDHDDDTYLPVQALLGELSAYGSVCGDSNCSWHVLVPKPLKPGAIGMFPVDYVSLFPDSAYDNLVRQSGNTLEQFSRQFGRTVVPEEIDGVRWIRYRENYLIHAYQVRKYRRAVGPEAKRVVANREHPVALLQGTLHSPCRCNWSPHLNHIAIVKQSDALAVSAR